MTTMAQGARRGTSLIDLLVSMAIVAVLFGGIYLIYFSIITSIANISVRTAAATAINAEIETIRNLPYDSVGTVSGIPPGIIPQTQAVSVGNYSFTLQTTVRNIDDPFDGTVSGNPAPVDTAPADYKLVEVRATCPLCTNFVAVTITATVAPKSLESATQNGSLFLFALDANGNGVAGATMHVVNASVTPSIDLTDTTNASGVLQLVGVPTSTEGYQIFASKAGYSADQTYPTGGASNPNPVKPNATVAAQTVTSVTLSIDRTSALSIHSSDGLCAPVGNIPFTMNGAKLIGTAPDILKTSLATSTDASGFLALPSVEWDTYALALSGGSSDLLGTIPLSPLAVNPSSTADFRFVVRPAADPALLVTAVDSISGAGVPGASVTAAAGAFSETLAAGHAFVSQSDWSGGQFSSQSGGVNTSVAGKIMLLINASGTYNVNTNDWLISNTIDLGGASTTFYGIAWTPSSEPAGTSVQFQVAANNDNATWNFVTVSPGPLPALLSGNRYLRYRVFLNTTDENATPEIDGVTFEFSGNCVPPYQALFTGLAQGTYAVTVTAPNYADGSSTAAVGPGESFANIPLTHL